MAGSSSIEQTCSVEIQIYNKSSNITLESPRSYFPRANCPSPPDLVVPPGSSTTVRFTSCSYECKGVLVYESDTFTLAIYFYNPVKVYTSLRELGLEVSLSKRHRGKLQDIYEHMSGWGTKYNARDTACHCIELGDSQETARVSIGPVQVLATMSDSSSSVINVVVRENPLTPREWSCLLL